MLRTISTSVLVVNPYIEFVLLLYGWVEGGVGGLKIPGELVAV